MMVAVSKVEEDKSVIISTVDPNGLAARFGLFKGLTLESVSLESTDSPPSFIKQRFILFIYSNFYR